MEAKLFVFTAVAISEVFSACTPTNTKFENFQKSPKRSIPFTIGVITTKCPGLNEFYYDWKVQEVPGSKVVKTSSGETITIDGYAFPSSNVFVVDYLVIVKVSHFPDMSSESHAMEPFHFAPNEMHIEILGGSEKTHLYGQDLIMDARSLSRDLSYPPGEDAFAGNQIKWVIIPEPINWTPPSSLFIVVPSDALENNVDYIFSVTVTRTKIPRNKDIKKGAQIVNVIKGKFPQLDIFCVRNCIHPHPLEITVFGLNCMANCDNLEYDWWLVPKLEKSQMDFGDGFDTIVILAGSYQEGQSVEVGVKSGLSRVKKMFHFATGLVAGNCSITPKNGISAVTRFKVKCKGFESPYGVVIYNIYQIKNDEKVLISESSYFDVSEIYLSDGNPARLKIEVQDNAYLLAAVELTVLVSKYQPVENIEVISGLKQLVLATDLTSIKSYAIEGYYNKAVQLTSALLDTLEELKIDNSTIRDLHKHMAEAIVRMEPGRFANIFQLMLILLKLDSHRLEDDSDTSELIGRALANGALSVHQMHNHELDVNIPQGYIEQFIMQALNIISNLLKNSHLIVDALEEHTPVHDYDSYDDYVHQKIQIRDNFKNLMRNLVFTMQTNCITALYKTIPGERPKLYANDLVSITTERKLLNPNNKLTLDVKRGNITEAKVILPVEFIQKIENINYFVDYQTAVFSRNPFWWHENASSFRTAIILFDLFVRCDKIKNIESPFLIEFEILSLPTDAKRGTLIDKNVAAYRVTIEPHRTLFVRFDNVPNDYTTYRVTWADCYCNQEDFKSERSKIIANGTDPAEKNLQIRNERRSWKIVYVCVKKLTSQVSYAVRFTTFSCVHWDIKKEEWLRDGCRVAQVSDLFDGDLVCECRHFSLFAGQIFVPPNSLISHTEINFAIAFFQNYLMILFVSGILSLWILLLTFAHYKDKKMRRKNVVHKLDDNVPGDRYAYLVVFFTGFFFDAQTTADVAFQLIGELSNSRIHLVKCKGFKLLQRNTQDWFTVYTPAYLGHLKKIKLWHNCKGKSPHWYCERVIIQDLRTATQYCFTVKKWFSLIWGTGKIYREIRIRRPTSKIPEILFQTQFESDMKDKHIWLSILVRDFQSNFNSKERVSVGFVFLFLSMLANAMFYGVPRGAPVDSIDENKYFINTTQIMIFIESWLVATPLGLLIVFFFKNSRPL